ncbi:PREDICTED: galactose-3-O-sulfotransferase 2-like [Branchiostoma belcheri]|uniref:Galactose-3-O-sulfotransferase 2-like n=1 Tax=Branchiostoma belcheri TaxID=7741 RepID=A0A6P5AFE8_BRABE|nr:PREDICTED: galactose-3-O-sulfotransferase 2-like [Branchiostoma belcheri]
MRGYTRDSIMKSPKRMLGIILLVAVAIFTYTTFNRPVEKGPQGRHHGGGKLDESVIRSHKHHRNRERDYEIIPPFEMPVDDTPDDKDDNSTMAYTTVHPTTAPEIDRDRCRPHHNVAFIKVHRSGSSTVQNIFLRYAYDHDLVVGLPRMPESPWVGCRSVIKSSDVMELAEGVKWNIFAHHSTYNRSNFDHFMHEDTRFVGILRKPINRLRSVFYALRLEQYFPGLEGKENDTGLMKYLRDPAHWDNKFSHPATCFEHDACVQDCMAKDLGLPPGELDGEAIDTFIHNLGKDFTLLLILEHLNHSLVLLKRRMCWQMEDILYWVSAEDDMTNYEEKEHFTEKMVSKYKRSSRIDYHLYEHFNASLWRQISLEGRDFLEEVYEFERILRIVNERCQEDDGNFKIVEATEYNKEIYITWSLCTKLRFNRLAWDENIRGMQEIHYGKVESKKSFGNRWPVDVKGRNITV